MPEGPGTDAPAALNAETVCPQCGGFGFFVRRVPVDHEDFGRAFPCDCTLRKRHQRVLQRMAEFTQLDALRDRRFGNFIQTPPGYDAQSRLCLEQAHATCRRFAERPEGWLFLHGPHGTGKTHLSAAIANELQARDVPVLFLLVPDLLDQLRATFDPANPVQFTQVFDLVRQVDVLILDDLGSQSSTPWAREKLFQILNHRYIQAMATILTSNLMVWEYEPRLQSRLSDARLVRRIVMDAPDYRAYGSHAGLEDDFTGLNRLNLHQEQRFSAFHFQWSGNTAQEMSSIRERVKRIQAYAQHPVGWLTLNGPHGCGKTHLAAAVANTWRAEGKGVLFVTGADLRDFLLQSVQGARNHSFPEVFAQLRRTPLMVLDDFRGMPGAGGQGSGGWASEKIQQLLEYRYQAELPTVITLCTPMEQMEGWLKPRILNRDHAQYIQLADFPAPNRARRGRSL